MIVYGSSLSPYARKVMVFAAEKKIDIEMVAGPDLQNLPAFREASPFGKMPALRDGDFTLADSTAIITYLDALHPEPNLLPIDPKPRAKTIWYEEFADTLVMAAGGQIFFNRVVAPRFLGRPGDLAAADRAEQADLPRLLAYLEGVIPASGYLVEDRFTLADIAVASPFATLVYADCAVCQETYPRTAAYLAAIFERPSFAAILKREKAFLGRLEAASA